MSFSASTDRTPSTMCAVLFGEAEHMCVHYSKHPHRRRLNWEKVGNEGKWSPFVLRIWSLHYLPNQHANENFRKRVKLISALDRQQKSSECFYSCVFNGGNCNSCFSIFSSSYFRYHEILLIFLRKLFISCLPVESFAYFFLLKLLHKI